MAQGGDPAAFLHRILDRAELVAERQRGGIEVGDGEREPVEVRVAIVAVGRDVGTDEFDDRLAAAEEHLAKRRTVLVGVTYSAYFEPTRLKGGDGAFEVRRDDDHVIDDRGAVLMRGGRRVLGAARLGAQTVDRPVAGEIGPRPAQDALRRNVAADEAQPDRSDLRGIAVDGESRGAPCVGFVGHGEFDDGRRLRHLVNAEYSSRIGRTVDAIPPGIRSTISLMPRLA